MSGCSRAKILGDKSWRGRQLSIKIVARRRIKVNVAGRRRKKEKRKKKKSKEWKRGKSGEKKSMTLFQASDIPHRRILDMKTNDRTRKNGE